jgi:hypothetical protein
LSKAERESTLSPGSRGDLEERAVRILAFEQEWGRHAGAKEEAVRELFGLSPTRYYQILDALVDSPAALAHNPMLINRLQRVRDARAAARGARRLGGSEQKKDSIR